MIRRAHQRVAPPVRNAYFRLEFLGAGGRAGGDAQRKNVPLLSDSSGRGNTFLLHSAKYYQSVVEMVKEGDEVWFRPNAENEYDRNAIEVCCVHGVLGCVPRDRQADVSGCAVGEVHLFPYKKSKKEKSTLTGVKVINVR